MKCTCYECQQAHEQLARSKQRIELGDCRFNDQDWHKQKATTSAWLERPDPYLERYGSSTAVPTYANIVIIGSGLSGTSVAHHLANAPKPTSIVMLEAREVCSGATGRNGGHLAPNLYADYLAYCKLYGKEQAALHVELEIQNYQEIQRVIEQLGIDCEFSRQEGLDIFTENANFERARKNLAALLADSSDPIINNHRVLFKDMAERLAGVRGCVGCIKTPLHASFNPYKFVCGLLRHLIVKRKISLHCNTPVHSVDHIKDGSYWRIKTSNGTIVCRDVVIAANGYTSTLLPEFKALIIPTRGQIQAWPAKLNHLYAPLSINDGSEYVVQRSNIEFPDFVLGGGRRYGDNYEYGLLDDGKLNKDVSGFLHAVGTRTRALADSKPRLEWTGIMGFSADSQPWIGSLKSISKDHAWVIGNGYQFEIEAN